MWNAWGTSWTQRSLSRTINYAEEVELEGNKVTSKLSHEHDKTKTKPCFQ